MKIATAEALGVELHFENGDYLLMRSEARSDIVVVGSWFITPDFAIGFAKMFGLNNPENPELPTPMKQLSDYILVHSKEVVKNEVAGLDTVDDTVRVEFKAPPETPRWLENSVADYLSKIGPYMLEEAMRERDSNIMNDKVNTLNNNWANAKARFASVETI
jgi:hypothetical protein